jgi:lon-related putative ATP-dependent protease
MSIKSLPSTSLFTPCEFAGLEFGSTDELEELKEIAGQTRALEALHFGVGIKRHGYNLFVMGPSGMGKCSTAREYLEQQAAGLKPPDDWCYVNNFELPHKPTALRLSAGRGREFRDDMRELVDDLLAALPSAFESDQYSTRHGEIGEEVEEKRDTAIHALYDEAESHNIRLVRSTTGFSFQPLRNGEVVTPDEYDHFSDEEKARVEEVVAVLQEKLEHIIRQLHQWKRDAKQRIRDLNKEVAMAAVGVIIAELKRKYEDVAAIGDYLDAVQQDVIENHTDFLRDGDGMLMDGGENLGRYEVNLLVDNSDRDGLPVLYEDMPNYDRLVGRIEHIAQMGTLITDFRLIKPGALHSANGGFVIIDIVKLLTQPFAWEGLKRALSEREIGIQSVGQVLGLVSTVSLEPEPIPLDIKVVLLGDRMLFYLLLEYDPEFPELFKVAADFENSMERSAENQSVYARMIATIVRREELLAFERHAVARIMEYSSRLTEDAEKLSNHLLSVTDLMREADYFAREEKRELVGREHVQCAIDANIRRADRLRDRVYEEIARGTLLIDTAGEKTGQVNGLSVAELGNFSFGQPFRITATARLGSGEVVDIEREVELSGAIHSKGVLILSSFIGERYAKNHPLSLHASLVFEQSYGGVEGDSASMGELCALLSVLADVPVRQNLAITGSVNQHGQAQAIGGVNEKIEGFFDICNQKSLSGEQGVIIPASNVKHLMLRDDVVQACEQGQFHIYPMETVDEAIELLTGVEAGVRGEDGVYTEGSINARVQLCLEELARLRHEFGQKENDSEEE